MTIKEVTKLLFERYRNMIAANSYSFQCDSTLWLCEKALQRVDEWPIDKTSRWLGFVQATVIAKGLTTIEEERNFSRPLFHQAYKEANIVIPKTENP
jgi:hypothetical protein